MIRLKSTRRTTLQVKSPKLVTKVTTRAKPTKPLKPKKKPKAKLRFKAIRPRQSADAPSVYINVNGTLFRRDDPALVKIVAEMMQAAPKGETEPVFRELPQRIAEIESCNEFYLRLIGTDGARALEPVFEELNEEFILAWTHEPGTAVERKFRRKMLYLQLQLLAWIFLERATGWLRILRRG